MKKNPNYINGGNWVLGAQKADFTPFCKIYIIHNKNVAMLSMKNYYH